MAAGHLARLVVAVVVTFMVLYCQTCGDTFSLAAQSLQAEQGFAKDLFWDCWNG